MSIATLTLYPSIKKRIAKNAFSKPFLEREVCKTFCKEYGSNLWFQLHSFWKNQFWFEMVKIRSHMHLFWKQRHRFHFQQNQLFQIASIKTILVKILIRNTHSKKLRSINISIATLTLYPYRKKRIEVNNFAWQISGPSNGEKVLDGNFSAPKLSIHSKQLQFAEFKRCRPDTDPASTDKWINPMQRNTGRISAQLRLTNELIPC